MIRVYCSKTNTVLAAQILWTVLIALIFLNKRAKKDVFTYYKSDRPIKEALVILSFTTTIGLVDNFDPNIGYLYSDHRWLLENIYPTADYRLERNRYIYIDYDSDPSWLEFLKKIKGTVSEKVRTILKKFIDIDSPSKFFKKK